MPFLLAELGEIQPAGDYVIETQEELLQGISFLAYQRVQTQIHLHPRPGVMQKLTVDPKRLADALRRDEATADMTADHKAGHDIRETWRYDVGDSW
jgi:hypothetical protein